MPDQSLGMTEWKLAAGVQAALAGRKRPAYGFRVRRGDKDDPPQRVSRIP